MDWVGKIKRKGRGTEGGDHGQCGKKTLYPKPSQSLFQCTSGMVYILAGQEKDCYGEEV